MIFKLIPLFTILVSVSISFLIVIMFGLGLETDEYFLLSGGVSVLAAIFQSYAQAKWFNRVISMRGKVLFYADLLFIVSVVMLLCVTVYSILRLMQVNSLFPLYFYFWLLILILTGFYKVFHHGNQKHYKVYVADAFGSVVLILLILWMLPLETPKEVLLALFIKDAIICSFVFTGAFNPMRFKFKFLRLEGYSLLFINSLAKPLSFLDKILLSYIEPGLLSLYNMTNSISSFVQKYLWQVFSLPLLAQIRDEKKYVLTSVNIKIGSVIFLQVILSLLAIKIYGDSSVIIFKLFELEIPKIIYALLLLTTIRITWQTYQSIISQLIYSARTYGRYAIALIAHDSFWMLVKIATIRDFGFNLFLAILAIQFISAFSLVLVIQRSVLK